MKFYAVRYWRGSGTGKCHLSEPHDRFEDCLEDYRGLREAEGISCPEIIRLKVEESMDMWEGQWRGDNHE